MFIVEIIIFFVRKFVISDVIVCYVVKFKGINSGVIVFLIIVIKLFFIFILKLLGLV